MRCFFSKLICPLSVRKLLFPVLLMMGLLNQLSIFAQPKLSGGKLQGKILSPVQLKKDFQVLKKTFRAAHAGLYRHTPKVKIDSAFASIETKINKPMSELEFFRLLIPLKDLIHDAHTSLMLSRETFQNISKEARFLPLDVRYINRKAFVEKSFSTSDTTVPYYGELVSINGKSMQEITEKILKLKSVDGYNLCPKYDMASSSFWLMYFLAVDTSNIFTVKLKNENTQLTTSHLLKGVPRQAIQEGQFNIHQQDSFSVKLIENKSIAIMSIPTFLDLKLVHQFADGFRLLKENKIKSLIIDIRDNTGGYDELNTELLSYIIPHPFKFYKNYSYRAKDWKDIEHTTYDAEDFWNTSEIKSIPEATREKLLKEKSLAEALTYYMQTNTATGTHSPKADNFFSGDIYLLFNGGSASSGGEVPALLHSYGIGTLIGEEPNAAYEGTTAGVLTNLTLPESGLRTRIPLIAYENNVPAGVFKGRGTIPNFEVAQKIEDAIRDIDTVIEFTLRLIAERKQ